MRVLCDHHVASRYVRAFGRVEWITVSTVREQLSPEAPDGEIAAFAAANDWVVFTNDDDFHGSDVTHGLVVYSQIDDPRPGDVIEAFAAITDAYAVDSEIDEVVPDGWI